jgi:hypothetical protein
LYKKGGLDESSPYIRKIHSDESSPYKIKMIVNPRAIIHPI